MQALDGAEYDGSVLKVSLAKRNERQSNRTNTPQDRNGQGRGWSRPSNPRPEGGLPPPARAMGSNNWRSRDAQ